jgi:hypothetical protein
MGNIRTAKLNTFIATLPRSGSTLLGMILDQHSIVYHAGETFFWGRLSPHNLQCSCGYCPCPILMGIYDAIRGYGRELEILFKTCSMLSRPARSDTSYVNFSVAGFNDAYPDEDWLKLHKYIDISCNTLEMLFSIFRKILNRDIIGVNPQSETTS